MWLKIIAFNSSFSTCMCITCNIMTVFYPKVFILIPFSSLNFPFQRGVTEIQIEIQVAGFRLSADLLELKVTFKRLICWIRRHLGSVLLVPHQIKAHICVGTCLCVCVCVHVRARA